MEKKSANDNLKEIVADPKKTEESIKYNIKRESFSKFLTVLSIIQDHCTDCDISQGVVRQKSNDRRTFFEFDLSKEIGELSLSLTLVKRKIFLLKSFEVDPFLLPENTSTDVIFEKTSSNYVFSDVFSSIRFRIPNRKYLDNTYVNREEFENLLKLKEENLLLSTTIPNYLSKRIKNITSGFENEIIIFNMNEYKANLCAETVSKDDTSILIQGIELNSSVNKCQCRFLSLPFTIDITTDITCNIYKMSDTIFAAEFKMNYLGVPIGIYSYTEVSK
ncbi:MAG: hypothetical protein QXG00_06065 [Candidatus Woesearchaeota archaeon]